MNIPKSFTLYAEHWNVEHKNDPTNPSNYGECDGYINTITLQHTVQGKQMSENKIESTFYHELVHAILDTSGYYGLSDDEDFVHTFGGLLHQYFKTVEYEE